MEKSAKTKGNEGELRFAAFLRENGLRAYKEASSGAHSHKGDIVNTIDCTIEVKTVKKLNLKEAWEQVAGDASMARNSPLLAIHYDGMPANEWLVVMHSEDWIELMRREEPVQATSDHRTKYALQNLIESTKRVLKLYES